MKSGGQHRATPVNSEAAKRFMVLSVAHFMNHLCRRGKEEHEEEENEKEKENAEENKIKRTRTKRKRTRTWPPRQHKWISPSQSRH